LVLGTAGAGQVVATSFIVRLVTCVVHMEAAALWLDMRNPALGVLLIRMLLIRTKPLTFSCGYLPDVVIYIRRIDRARCSMLDI
jgi:hypothetical protein